MSLFFPALHYTWADVILKVDKMTKFTKISISLMERIMQPVTYKVGEKFSMTGSIHTHNIIKIVRDVCQVKKMNVEL